MEAAPFRITPSFCPDKWAAAAPEAAPPRPPPVDDVSDGPRQPRCRAPYRWWFRGRTADSHGRSWRWADIGRTPSAPSGPTPRATDLHAGRSRRFLRARQARATLTWESRDVRGRRGAVHRLVLATTRCCPCGR